MTKLKKKNIYIYIYYNWMMKSKTNKTFKKQLEINIRNQKNKD